MKAADCAHRLRVAAFLVPALVLLALAWPGLATRIVHTDEAVNAVITGRLLAGEAFDYQAHDHHGPTYFALSAIVARAAGAHDLASLDETSLRAPAVVSGLVVVAAFAWLALSLGAPPVFAAAWLWVVSPLALYFGRYAIHETLFVALTIALVAALQHPGGVARAVLVGIAGGLLLATKETALAVFLALAAASLGTGWRPWRTPPREVLLGLAAFACVLAGSLTWGMREPGALGELLASVPGYLARAGGQGHENSVFYYATLLGGSPGGLAVLALALAGCHAAWQPGCKAGWRFLVFYALAVAVIFSLIPYKNPWLALSLWWPLVVLAGLGVTTLRPPWLGGAALCLTVALLLHEAMDRVYRRAGDERNPYAYAHTSEDLARISGVLAARDAIAGREVAVAVLADDPWPLPWLLRDRTRVGYWKPSDPLPEADVWIVDAAAATRHEGALNGLRPAIFGQRPGVLLVLYGRP